MFYLNIGTRSSELALIQTNLVIKKLKEIEDIKAKIITVQSTGDMDLKTPLHKMNTQGVFSKELDNALLSNKIDIAVHSLKDLPSKLDKNLHLIAIPERICIEDALISKKKTSFGDLKKNAIIYTGSVRRKSQLLHYNKYFKIEGIRGNLNTRIDKFFSSNADALILAGAGLIRLKKENLIVEYLPNTIMIPTPCQGAIGIVINKKNIEKLNFLEKLNNPIIWLLCQVERDFMRYLNVGCSTPFGAFATIKNNQICLQAAFYKEDGSYKLFLEEYSSILEAKYLAERLGDKFLKQGVKYLL